MASHLAVLFFRVRNIGRAFGIVDLGGDPILDLLVDEEEGGRVGVVPHLHLDLGAGHLRSATGCLLLCGSPINLDSSSSKVLEMNHEIMFAWQGDYQLDESFNPKCSEYEKAII